MSSHRLFIFLIKALPFYGLCSLLLDGRDRMMYSGRVNDIWGRMVEFFFDLECGVIEIGGVR